MYKYLIIGIALMFFSAGAYYINSAGGGLISDIVAGNITSEANLTPLNIEKIPGIYVCNTSTTCKNKYTLSLKNDKTLELTRTLLTTNNNPKKNQTDSDAIDTTTLNGALLTSEQGTWDLGVQNMLVMTLTGSGETSYTIPQKIIIKNVRNTTLSKISYTKNNYKDMISPIFIRTE